MRRLAKVLPIALGVFVVVMAALYTMVWFMQASEAEKQAKEIIAKINQQGEILTYDSLRTTGFPTELRLELVNPVFVGRVDEWIKILSAQLPVAPDGTKSAELKDMSATLPEWHEKIALQGVLGFSVNALSNRFTLSTEGKTLWESDMGGDKLSITANSIGKSVCDVKISKSNGLFGMMWDIDMQKHTKDMIHSFSSLECNFGGSQIVFTDSAEKIMQSGHLQLGFSLTPKAKNTTSFALHINQEAEAFAGLDKVMERYWKIIMPNDPFSDSLKYSLWGKQNFDCSMNGDFPDSPSMINSNASFAFDISKCSITNALYSSSTTMHVVHNVTADVRDATFQVHSDFTATAAYDDIVADMIRSDIKNFIIPETPEEKARLNQFSEQQLYDLFAPVIPKFSTMGTIVTDMDVSYQGNAAMTQGTATLAKAEFSTTPYGISANGNATMTPPQPIPTGTLNLNYRNGLSMVDDMGNWAIRLKAALQQIDPKTAQMIMVTPELISGVKYFLHQLATEESKQSADGTLQYTVVSAPPQDITINGKSMHEILTLYEQYVAPYLQPPQQ